MRLGQQSKIGVGGEWNRRKEGRLFGKGDGRRRVIQSAKYDPGNKNGHSALSLPLPYPKESLSPF